MLKAIPPPLICLCIQGLINSSACWSSFSACPSGLPLYPYKFALSARKSLKQPNVVICMAKLVPVVCPQCCAELQIPGDLKKAYCTYCGTQIVFEKEVEKTSLCPECGGTGKCLPPTTSGRMVPTCHGTGICAACAGTGKTGDSPCGLCKGSGKCSSCGGTGKCSKCEGSGRIVS